MYMGVRGTRLLEGIGVRENKAIGVGRTWLWV